jgi:hypothetical protein
VLAFLDRRPSALVAVEDQGIGYRLTGHFPPGELPGSMVITDLADLLAQPASRVIIRDPAATPDEFVQLAAELDLPNADHSVGWSAWLDLTPVNVTKASGQLRRSRDRRWAQRHRDVALGRSWRRRGPGSSGSPSRRRRCRRFR